MERPSSEIILLSYYSQHAFALKSFNFKTNWLLLIRVCSPNPLMKYLKYLQITHFFHHFPQTSYRHTNSQDNLITEPLLLLYWQQCFPRTVTTLQADTWFWCTGGSSAHCASVGNRLCLSSATHPFPCSPLYTPANPLLYKQPNLIHSNQISQVGRALLFKIFHFYKQHCQRIWEGTSLKQKGCLPELT